MVVRLGCMPSPWNKTKHRLALEMKQQQQQQIPALAETCYRPVGHLAGAACCGAVVLPATHKPLATLICDTQDSRRRLSRRMARTRFVRGRTSTSFKTPFGSLDTTRIDGICLSTVVDHSEVPRRWLDDAAAKRDAMLASLQAGGGVAQHGERVRCHVSQAVEVFLSARAQGLSVSGLTISVTVHMRAQGRNSQPGGQPQTT